MISAEEFLAARDMESAPDPTEEPHGRAASVRRRRRFQPRQYDEDLEGVDAPASRRPALSDDEAHDEYRCQEAALTLLDAAARSTATLRKRLTLKGYAPETIEVVISNLTRVGLLDDLSYARGVTQSCLGRCMGRRGTVMELVRKGVDRHMAEEVASEFEERGDFEQSARRLAMKVSQRTRGLDRQVRLRRFWSAGGRKGHSPADLKRLESEFFS
ncbi:MAG: regulatory protein RecX [Bifidobacteriaceae bacterium]|nr:regulatory protein RecX [Bifidobacteriaceae bacterium]